MKCNLWADLISIRIRLQHMFILWPTLYMVLNVVSHVRLSTASASSERDGAVWCSMHWTQRVFRHAGTRSVYIDLNDAWCNRCRCAINIMSHNSIVWRVHFGSCNFGRVKYYFDIVYNHQVSVKIDIHFSRYNVLSIGSAIYWNRSCTRIKMLGLYRVGLPPE